MTNLSAGLLIYRVSGNQSEFFLVHPGGPFWKNKDAGAWSIPKGLVAAGEDPLTAALRECREETGYQAGGSMHPLPPVKLKSGKNVMAWLVSGDPDPLHISSNEFEIEWPPRSGKKQFFPEVDKAAWFSADEARRKLNPALSPLIDAALDILKHTKIIDSSNDPT